MDESFLFLQRLNSIVSILGIEVTYLIFVQTQMVGKLFDIEPEQRTTDAKAFVFREVLRQQEGYARGLGV